MNPYGIVDTITFFWYNQAVMKDNLTLLNVGNSKTKWEYLALKSIDNCPKIKKEREKKVLLARFGILGKIKTLQSIGTEYGITRERVRQIIANSIKKMQDNCGSNEVKKALKNIEEFIKNNGGYVSLEELYEKFSNKNTNENNSLRFITSLSKDLELVKNSHDIQEGFRLKKIKLSELKNTAKDALRVLKEGKKTLTIKEISNTIKIEEGMCRASLSASNKAMPTDSGKWGLASWSHVNPKSIRDKSKYVMKRHGKPIHYQDLASKITDLGNKNVTKQSVHNELIKNKDFVLVGRGIYALSEWGYTPGIVEEVITEILKYENEPLHKDVIIERVLKKRIVKPSTIVLNLQKSKFKKVGNATYTIN